MDVSYTILPGAFEVQAAEMESEEIQKILGELVRLSKEGFGVTQTALDLAIEAKSRVSKMCLLLLKTKTPEAFAAVTQAQEVIRELDKVILNIKQAMEES